MYTTNVTRSVREVTPADHFKAAQMKWLRAEIAREGRPDLAARRERERLEALRMLDPQSRREAYRRFGMFLGLLPPAAIFYRMFGHDVMRRDDVEWLFLLLGMNLICCVVGRAVGGKLVRTEAADEVKDFGWRAWLRLLACSLVMALAWGITTGAAGGALFFGLGAVPGAVMAVMVALVAFPAFAALHRPLARGGMIEARQLWPLALGIPSVIAAAILGIQ